MSRHHARSHRPLTFVLGLAASLFGLSWVALPSYVLAFGEDGVVPNLGQFHPEVLSLTRSAGVDVYVTDTGVVLDLWETSWAVVLPFPVGSGAEVAVTPQKQRGAKLHYFRGADPRRWVSNVPVYEEVLVRDLSTARSIWVKPERDGLRYRIDADSRLAEPAWLATCDGAQSLRRLPQGTVRAVCGEYVLHDAAAENGERLLSWDRPSSRRPSEEASGGSDSAEDTQRRDDPNSLLYCTYFGGSNHDRAHALLVDPAGEPILGGYTRSSNFPATAGAYDDSYNGDYDCHIAKFDMDATTLHWATFVGGALEDRVFALHQDANGDLIFSGHTYSSNFPTSLDAFDRTLGGTRDAYVGKLSEDGSTLHWATYLGGSDLDRSWDMNLDSMGRPVLSGDTYSSDFPSTPGALQETFTGTAGWSDGFATKVRPDGTGLEWSTFLGGGQLDYVKFMDMGSDDTPYLCGATNSADFPTTPGAFQPIHASGTDVFLTRLSADGSSLVYSTYIGGNSADLGEVVVVDPPTGEAVVTGTTISLDFPVTAGAYDTTHNGAKDAFVFRLGAAGDTLHYCTYVGGSGADEPWAMVLDLEGAPIFSGYVQSVDFPTTLTAFDSSHNGLQDANVTRLSPDGSDLRYSSYFGGSDLDGGWEMALDSFGNPMVTGPTGSPDLPTTPGVYDTSHNGNRDVFLAVFRVHDASGADGPGGLPVPAAGRLADLRVVPNPLSETTEARFRVRRSALVELRVLDVAGRAVARLFAGQARAGEHAVSWDARDASGRPVPSGVYWLQALEGTQPIVRRRIVVVR